MAHPDLEVVLRPSGGGQVGLPAGPVTIHPPLGAGTRWSILEDVTQLLDEPTNADAEDAIRQEVAVTDPALLGRLGFDTEAGALGVDAQSEADIRAVAAIIGSLVAARPR